MLRAAFVWLDVPKQKQQLLLSLKLHLINCLVKYGKRVIILSLFNMFLQIANTADEKQGERIISMSVEYSQVSRWYFAISGPQVPLEYPQLFACVPRWRVTCVCVPYGHSHLKESKWLPSSN